jgi:hypothetical protein
MDKKKADNTKTNKKRVNNTNFKTNLTVQAVYGREAVRHMLKNGLKTQKMHFLPVFELMLDSLTAI